MKYAGAAINMNTYDYNSRVLPVLGYVAQLVPLPASFAMEQRRALHDINKYIYIYIYMATSVL